MAGELSRTPSRHRQVVGVTRGHPWDTQGTRGAGPRHRRGHHDDRRSSPDRSPSRRHQDPVRRRIRRGGKMRFRVQFLKLRLGLQHPGDAGCPMDVPGSYQRPGDAGEASGRAFRSQIAKYKKLQKTKKTVQKTKKKLKFLDFFKKKYTHQLKMKLYTCTQNNRNYDNNRN